MTEIQIRIERIREMENILNDCRSFLDGESRDESDWDRMEPLFRKLETYYTGPLWKEDLEADEAGLLPPSLERGVLSQDAVYDLLTDEKEWKKSKGKDESMLNKLKLVLEKKGYRVSVYETAKEAADALDARIDGVSVGFGGSVTLQQMGLIGRLSAHNQVYSHAEAKSPEELLEIQKNAHTADVYLTSANALAATGEIVNIDGRGNRVGSTIAGPKKVIFIIGKNKIAPDLEAAIFRARNVAAPKNAQRLRRKTPCAVKGDRCYDCNSPERICRVLSVFWRNLMGAETEVVLVNEELGY